MMGMDLDEPCYLEIPCRVIVHVDLDCFYCQVEQKRLGIPRDTPCAVQQWGGIIAINYAARARGASRFMKIHDAVKACPELRFVHVEVLDEHGHVEEDVIGQGLGVTGTGISGSSLKGKACLERYRQASTQIFDIFKSALPTAILEKAGIDEAFFDLTHVVEKQMQAVRDMSKGEAIRCADESSVVLSGPIQEDNDFDLRLAVAANLIRSLRADIFSQLDYTVSAGISHNKLLAKLASAMNKPYNQTIVPVRAVPGVMGTLPLRKIRSFGGKVGQVLEGAGCVSAADVQGLPFHELVSIVGDSRRAQAVAQGVRGICSEPVTEKDLPKSMLACKSFAPTSDWAEVTMWLRVLCEELATRMAADCCTHHRRPRNLVVHHRHKPASGRRDRAAAGQERSRSCTLPTGLPLTPSADTLVQLALAVLHKNGPIMPCNRLSVSSNDFLPLSGTTANPISSFFSRAVPQPTCSKPTRSSGTTDGDKPLQLETGVSMATLDYMDTPSGVCTQAPVLGSIPVATGIPNVSEIKCGQGMGGVCEPVESAREPCSSETSDRQEKGDDDVDLQGINASEQAHILRLIQMRQRGHANGLGEQKSLPRSEMTGKRKGGGRPPDKASKKQASITSMFKR